MPKGQGPAPGRHARAERMTLNVTAYPLKPCCRSHHFIVRPTWSGRLDLRGRPRASKARMLPLHHTPSEMQKAHRRRVVCSDPSDDGPDTHHTNGSACREKPWQTRHNQTAIGGTPTFRCRLIMASIRHAWFLSRDSAVNPALCAIIARHRTGTLRLQAYSFSV
jgi:hypothetical protein